MQIWRSQDKPKFTPRVRYVVRLLRRGKENRLTWSARCTRQMSSNSRLCSTQLPSQLTNRQRVGLNYWCSSWDKSPEQTERRRDDFDRGDWSDDGLPDRKSPSEMLMSWVFREKKQTRAEEEVVWLGVTTVQNETTNKCGRKTVKYFWVKGNFTGNIETKRGKQ